MALIDGISRRDLQRLALDALVAANTIALDRVFEPRDWPTKPELFPMLLVSTPRDRKAGIYPGQFEFTTTITLVVVGRVVGLEPDSVNNMLDCLAGEIEDALMLTPKFARHIQKFASIDTQSVVTADGRQHVGEIGIAFDLEVFQVFGDESFVPLVGVKSTIVEAHSGDTLAAANAVVSQDKPRGRFDRFRDACAGAFRRWQS